MKNNRPWTTLLVILTPILGFTSMLFNYGAGYDLLPILVFPLAFLETLWQNTLTFPFLVLASLQLPLYGIAIDSIKNLKHKYLAATAIIVAHISLIAVITTFGTGNYIFNYA